MELLQKIDIKSADNSQKRVDIQAREKPSNANSETGVKPFKEQLSEQAEQLNSQMNRKKDSPNQEDTAVQSTEDQSVDNNLESTKDAINETKPEEFKGSVVAVNIALGEQEMLSLSELEVAAAVIGIGNRLPLKEPLAVNLTAQIWTKSATEGLSSGPVSNNAKAQGKSAEAEVLMQNSNLRSNQMGVNSTGLEIRAAISESVQQKPLNIAPSLNVSLLEKSAMQDAKLTKMTSEFSTADVISQASRLQQVPITTAVSASLSSVQNMSAGVITTGVVPDTVNTLSQSTPLTNSPLNTLNASISANISNPNWSQQMTQQVAYMVKGGIQQAEIKLNPAHLGPMEIKLAIKDDQATISFVTQHAPVRDALDAALPRLKEMLEQQGLNLADADVSTQSEQREASSEKQKDNDDDSSNVLASTEMQSNSVKPMTSIMIDSGVSIFV